ncbi:MAG: RNA methyltransferase [Desulfobacteraceae bacterium]|nr:RNA methyltransferase [Desulfobacteraceae bacterium]MDH3572279.1 RNA methyltransferase [Desulfobacteraceae bacterium]MDH3721740.1 RNA methyltransferase [Desulfobacteraceae bacterium]MDH3835465.1 RNA methyltransferase [Desulfobacteraceae bacterium]MDH3874408.1 RNA methyltransferase [Desulfobacteraceae bacterium]
MSDRVNLDNISIVLLQSRYSENIGAAARAMRNMGIRQLVIVDPQNFDLSKALKLATHFASDIIEKSKFYPDLKEALSSFNYVVGTTARLGGQRQVVHTPLTLARNLIPISVKNRIAILFGPEDKGLSNEDIRYCHALVNIPTTEFSSLNLAQSVMILCYEIFIAGGEANEEFTPRMASRHELDGMYDQLKDILVRISYINSENPDYWLNHFRRFFTRLQLRAKEVNIIRGLCRQVDWYGKKCYKDGKKERVDNE